MSPLGLLVTIILVLILIGGIGPHFYTAAPWRTGYGYSWGGNGVVLIILIIVIVLAASGRF